MGQAKNEGFGILDNRASEKLLKGKMLYRMLLGMFVVLGIMIIFLIISNHAQAGDYGVEIQYNTPSNGIANVTPGIDYEYTVDIINTGVNNNGEDINFTVELDAASVTAGWIVTPTGTTIIPNLQMEIANKTTESVTVRAPVDAKFQDTAVVNITVEVIGHEGEVGGTDTLQLRANVVQIYGVLMTTTQDTKTGDPGENVSFEIKITNQGNGNDTFSFSALGPELGAWSVPDVDLISNEYVYIYYNLTINPDHDTSDILVSLNVTSTSDASGLTYDTLGITIHVDPLYDVKLGVNGSNNKEVGGGESVTFNLRIKNIGTATDTFDIEPVGTTAFWVTLLDLTITLDPDETVVVEVYVTPPEGTDIGLYNITINVTSQNDTSATDEYTFYADVQATYGVSFSISPPSIMIDPGDTIYITIHITNTGNDDDIFTIIITGLPPGWSHSLLWDVSVPPGWTVSVDIEIYTTLDTPPSVYSINITIKSVNDPTKEMINLFIVEVKQVYDVSLTSSTTAKTGEVGETVMYLIEMKNEGNGDDYIELSLSGEHTEFAILYYNETENGAIIHISPPSGGTLGVYLQVSIPSDYWDIETQDQFTMNVEAESLYDPSIPPASDSKPFTTTVNPVYGVDIISGGFQSSEPGDTLSFLIEVENTGSTTDSYNIKVDSVTTGTGGDTSLWYPEITFSGSLSGMTKGERRLVSMYVDIPFPSDLTLIPPGLYNITVEVTSINDPGAKDTQIFTVNVLQFYWADIQDTLTSKNVDVGETVQYSITIKNKGNDDDLLSVELEGDPNIPGSMNWGTLSHAGTGQVDQQSLVDIPLGAGVSTEIILKITIPERTDPAYPTINPHDVTLIVIVKPSDKDGIDDQVAVTTYINTIYEFDFNFLTKTVDVQPGDWAEFTLLIENTGTATETFTYDIYQWEVDWSVYGYTFIPSSGNLQVGAGQVSEVDLSINSPSDSEEAEGRDYNITIRVHSVDGNADVFKNCTIHMEPVYDVELTVTSASTSASVDVGNSVIYKFTVRNIGNTLETFSFAVSDLDTSSSGGGDQSGWAAVYLENDPTTPINSVDLALGESKSMLLEIAVPNLGDPSFVVLTDPLSIQVKCSSTQEPGMSDEFTTITTINPIYSFELSSTAPGNTKEGKPDDNVEFTLRVRNTGTAPDSYDFRVSSIDEGVFPGGTTITIIRISNLNIDSYGATTVLFTITSEKGEALVGTYPIEIRAESDHDASVTQSIILYIEITASAEVEIIPSSQTEGCEPGDMIDYPVKILNKGNAQDTFDLTLNGPNKEWGEIYDHSGTTKINHVTLEATGLPGYFTNIIIRITIPSTGETKEGEIYSFTITAASTNTEGVKDTAQVSTTIDRYIDLYLEYAGTGEPTIDYDPNKAETFPARFRFKMLNNGNVDETSITVNIDGMPGWNSPTIEAIDILEPGKNTTFSITFNIPSGEDEDSYDMDIYLTSTDGTFDSDPVEITINITKPDLVVADVLNLDDDEYLMGKVGDPITITATIDNIGDVRAESVQVKLYENDIPIQTKTISSIDAEESRDVTFRWNVPNNEVEIFVKVVPQDERDDGNNEGPTYTIDLRPDLSFTGDRLNLSISNPEPGENVTITAFIKNNGGNAEDVVVKFYQGTKMIGIDTLDIDHDEINEAILIWKVPDIPGENITITAEIDHSESKGDGDESTKSIEVAEMEDVDIPVSDKDEGPSDYLWMLLGLIIGIIIGILAAFLGFIIGKRSRDEYPKTDEEYQPMEYDMGYGEEAPVAEQIAEEPQAMPPPPPPPPPEMTELETTQEEGIEGKEGELESDAGEESIEEEGTDFEKEQEGT